MNPQHYRGNAPAVYPTGESWAGAGPFTWDEGWASLINPHQFIQRDPRYVVQDFDGIGIDDMGGPHPGVSPCVFADGSVRHLAYTNVTESGQYLMCKLWAFNDGATIVTNIGQ